MLQSLAIYLLKTIIVSGLLLLYYCIALRDKRFHYYNRFYLLSAIVLSIVLPLIDINLFTVFSQNDEAIKMFNVIYASGGELDYATIRSTSLDWQQIALVAIAAVTIFLLVGLSLRIFSIYRTKRKYPVTNMQEFDFVNTDLQQAPFSFLKNIFWRSDISMEERTGRLILQHELAHIKEKHTLDKLFMQVVVAVLWANPLYRLYQKELYLVHEFIADDKSVTDNDTAAFAEMLLHAHYGKFNFDPAQQFFYSPIKRRLLMLTTSKEPRFSYLRRIMALPLIACTVLLFAFRLQKENATETVATLKPGTSFKLVVDAGHGGQDNGAIGLNGAIEKDLTLTIAKKIKTLSPEYGVDVIMTRTDDIYMNPKEKADFANKQAADAFVSIHVSADPSKEQETKSGMDILISKNNDNKQLDKSKILGSAILQQLNKNFTVTPSLLQRQTGIWVLQETTVPAALIECGYLTNSKDLSLLKDDAQVELMARKILEGVVAYSNNNNSPINTNEVKMINENALGKDISGKVSDIVIVPTTSVNTNDTNITKENSRQKNSVTVSNADVLYIIDGKVATRAEVDALEKTNSIASVNVIKATVNKYGEKGKNGVVEITSIKSTANVTVNVTADKKPLYIVNGKEMSESDFKEKITPDDIKSIDVLKDDAAKKYGEKGKNGVLLITTKAN